MRHLYAGTTEYLTVTVYASVSLDAQAVHLSFDRTTWIAATWLGTAATQRQARALVNSGNMPAATTTPYTLYVRVNDGTEIPVMSAGQVTVH